MAKYRQIADSIERKIKTGEYPSGQKLPTISVLTKAYGASHMTVKNALGVLAGAGYVDRRQGGGVYVKRNAEAISRRIPLSGNSSRFPRGSLRTRVIRFGIAHPSAKVAEELQMDEEAFVYDIERIRIHEGKPIIIEYVYMPIEAVPGLTQTILEDSIYRHIRATLGRTISSSVFTITGVRPTGEDAAHLGVGPSDFLMQIVQTVYFDDGVAFEYSIDRHLPAAFAYSNVETELD